MANMYDSGLSQVSTKREKKPEPIKGIAKPFPPSAPARMHRSYYENNISNIKNIYKEQGMELPSYFDNKNTRIQAIRENPLKG